MVLKGNKRKSKSRVSAKPELEWNIKGSSLGSVKTSSGKGNSVSDHVIITGLKSRRNGEFIPDGEPVTILLVNSLSSDLYFNRLDEEVTNEVDPSEVSG